MVKAPRNVPCPCGSGLKYKRCCLARINASTPFESPADHGPSTAYLDDPTLLRPRAQHRSALKGLWRVHVEYTFPEPFGQGHVSYNFPADRLIFLDSWQIVTADQLRPGHRFQMEDGGIATVTNMGSPKWWDPPSDVPIQPNLYHRRILGRVEHVGNTVIDVHFAGQFLTTTPDHAWYSVTRDQYVPAASLRPGELLLAPDDRTLPCDFVSPPRYGHVKLYNIEVEQFHNYFVGNDPDPILVHNGIPGGNSCIPMPASVTAAERSMISEARLGIRTRRQLGIGPYPDHHIFPQEHRPWFADRGVSIDNFTVTVDPAIHSAIHYGGGAGRGGGWWNQTIMTNLHRQERILGRRLTPAEIHQQGQFMLQEAGLDHLPIHPWNSTK